MGELPTVHIAMISLMVLEEAVITRSVHFKKTADDIVYKEKRLFISSIDLELAPLEQEVLNRELILILLKLSDELVPLLELASEIVNLVG